MTLMISIRIHEEVFFTISLLQDVGYQICFVCMMESSDGELELLGQLHPFLAGILFFGDIQCTYPNKVVQIDSFVAMNLNFDSSTEDINKSLPLQVFRER